MLKYHVNCVICCGLKFMRWGIYEIAPPQNKMIQQYPYVNEDGLLVVCES